MFQEFLNTIQKTFINNPLRWVVLLLSGIGKITYKPFYILIKYAYIAVYILNTEYFKKLNSEKRHSTFSQSDKAIYRLALGKFFGLPNFRKTINFKNVFIFIYVVISNLTKFIKYLKSKITFKAIHFPKIRNFFPKLKLQVPLMILGISIFTFIIGGGIILEAEILRTLPDPKQLMNREKVLSTKIYARDGSLLYKIYRNQNRSLINLDDLPQHLINATISIEDQNFWAHPGFSLKGILRAFKNNVGNDSSLQGGSTITQQLVKNALLSPEQTYVRKIKELILSLQVEWNFSKRDILQMYFNEIPYGGVSYGIEEASQTFFGKSARDLTLAESAFLAGLPSAPSKFSPFGPTPELAVIRQHQVLKNMLDDEYISEAEYNEAINSKIFLKPPVDAIRAPHFTMYIKSLLIEKYGNRMVEEGGLEVYTSLDPFIQNAAQKSAEDELEKLAMMNVTNGAVVVTDPKTGEILAMVGSRNYFDTEHDGNVNVTLQLRQPGSSIKPVTYALALQNGLNPQSLILDAPVSYPDGMQPYRPLNYDGKFHGNVTLKTSLGSSFNIPAVKLINMFGIDNMITLAQNMGITTWNDRSRYGMSITLGGAEVKMVDMATVYGVFANMGQKVPVRAILKVVDSNGKVLEDNTCQNNLHFGSDTNTNNSKCQSQQVMSPFVAYQITDMLSDNNARIPAFGANSLLVIPNQQVAVKTGTTNDRRDNWAIGYTQDYVVVVWVGNNNNSAMSSVTSGITGATPIWHNTFKAVLDRDGKKIQFTPPAGMVAVEVCATNGYLPCKSCPQTQIQYFVPGTEPKVQCSDVKVEEPKKEN